VVRQISRERTGAGTLSAPAQSPARARARPRREASRVALPPRYAHKLARLLSPTEVERCRAVVRGIHRTIGTAKAPKAPATNDRLLAMVVPRSLPGRFRRLPSLVRCWWCAGIAGIAGCGRDSRGVSRRRGLAGVGGLLGLGKVLSPVERATSYSRDGALGWTARVWPGSSKSSGSIVIGASPITSENYTIIASNHASTISFYHASSKAIEPMGLRAIVLTCYRKPADERIKAGR
jgi:hypothetical protein